MSAAPPVTLILGIGRITLAVTIALRASAYIASNLSTGGRPEGQMRLQGQANVWQLHENLQLQHAPQQLYCHMWRFRVFLMFKHPALAAYTHFVSLDTDLYIVKRMPHNPVTFLANSSAVFATSRLKLDKRRRSDEAHAHPDLPPTKMTAAASCSNWLDDFWASAFDGIPRPFAHDYVAGAEITGSFMVGDMQRFFRSTLYQQVAAR